MKKFIIIIFILLIPVSVYAEVFPTIDRNIFGFYLGESIDSLKKRSDHKKSLENRSVNRDFPGSILLFMGALNSNEAVLKTTVLYYNSQIYKITIYFVDSSKRNYKVLQQLLTDKYGEDESGLFDSIKAKTTFLTNFDGQEVTIILNRDISFSYGDTLTISYSYNNLYEKVIEEYERRKAEKLKNDL
jgi:hypothetical protein